MAANKSAEIKVGIVTISAIIIFILGLSFARGCNVSVSQKTLKFRFNSSGGLQVSNPVVVNGVRRGVVTSVVNDKGSVLINAIIDETGDIMSDATAKISILEITGGKKIELNPGKFKHNFDINNEIPGVNSFDLGDLVTTAGDMSTDLIHILHRLDTLTDKMNEMFTKNNLAEKINNIVVNADVIMTDTKNILNQNEENINTTLKNVKLITTDLKKDYSKYEPRLDTLMTNLESALKSVKKLLVRADTSLEGVNLLLADAKGLTTDIRTGQGLVSRLIYDKVLSTKIDSTLKSVDDFLNLIKQYGVNVNLRLGTRP